MENGTSSTDMNLASQYALRVALQTMKERCMSLQQRLSIVEEENQLLRGRVEDDITITGTKHVAPNPSVYAGQAEIANLKSQMSELNRQKSQLSEHITMVANENQRLWSRLSKIDKDENDSVLAKDSDCIFPADISPTGGASQNLIRSKTFTQHSPNPNLRHKIIPCESGDARLEKGIKDLSLEEVTLDNCHDGNTERDTDLELKKNSQACETDLGFAYLNVDGNDADFNVESKKCIEGLEEIRREVLKQHNDLSSAFTVLESRIAVRGCPECAKKTKKPEMADKSLETEESITEMKMYHPVAVLAEASCRNTTTINAEPDVVTRMDFLEEKIKADELDKTCPMCGKSFSRAITFNAFREHVETHFIDDSELETSVDRNFEFISHTVGDF